jgi:hypothetical protein
VIKMANNLMQMIISFIELQEELLSKIKSDLGERDWQFLTDIPHYGSVEIRGQNWCFSKHGNGIKFTFNDTIIDANSYLDKGERLFDAGRIAEYLESIGKGEVVYECKKIVFSFVTGGQVLREMACKGLIQRVDGLNGEIYKLPESQSI